VAAGALRPWGRRRVTTPATAREAGDGFLTTRMRVEGSFGGGEAATGEIDASGQNLKMTVMAHG
jgi:hypothetical protein